jgi:two-component system sensor histidine kinase TctE
LKAKPGPEAAAAPARVFGDREELNSLFGEILDWMLAPLLFLWPISIAATHHIAEDIANHPYDQVLAQGVATLTRSLAVEGHKIVLALPAQGLPRSDDDDTVYFQIRGPRGEFLAGDSDVPAVPEAIEAPRLILVPGGPEVPPTLPVEAKADAGAVHFRDDRISGDAVRVAYARVPLLKGQPPVLVQVAETRHKREALVSRIISGVLLPQFAIIPLTVILVYLGLTKGLAPLGRLRDRIRGRRVGDLSRIPIFGVPDEVRPLVVSFNEMMARLEENLQAQQRFIADAAHQMKTPLTGLKTQTELALRETDPGQMRLELTRIAESADRTAHLIQQLLALARAEASHEKVHKAVHLDAVALAREITGEWTPRALARHIDLAFEGIDRPLPIEGVPLLLRELLNNLIDNAIKYTPAGGHVTVRVRGDEFVAVEVEDDGAGIPEAERERVFERFYRVLGTEADGSGLGLPIVQEIAALHSAGVDLASGAHGKGTRVTVVFPRRGSDLMPYDLRQKN